MKILDSPIIVSVCCLTYNHEKYVRQCLDGFIMQKTNFIFEILVHDDASTDKTQDIIREYEAKYPHFIKPVYQKINQYSQGISPLRDKLFPKVKGKYIAICEGDDYWIDPLKLQKQVDILEKKLSVSLVFTERFVLSGVKMKENILLKNNYTTDDLLSGFVLGLQTLCFRNFDFSFNACGVNGDILIPYICSLHGSLYCLHNKTAVYRITGVGLATSRKLENILKISLNDMYKFHKAFDFPSNRLLIKAYARYVYQDIIRKIRSRDFNLYASLVSFYSYKRFKSDFLYFAYYLLYFFFLQILRFIGKIFRK